MFHPNIKFLYYFQIKIEVSPKFVDNQIETFGSKFIQTIGVILDINDLNANEQKEFDKLLINGFYVHGKAGIFNEINVKGFFELLTDLISRYEDNSQYFVRKAVA